MEWGEECCDGPLFMFWPGLVGLGLIGAKTPADNGEIDVRGPLIGF